MKKKYLIAIAFSCVVIINLASFPLFMPDDPEVADLKFLYSRAGVVFPEASFPVSTADLDEHAERLVDILSDNDEGGASIASVREYRRGLKFDIGRPIRGQELKLQAAGFLIGDADTSASSEDYRHPNDFYTRFVQFPDIAYLALWAGVQ